RQIALETREIFAPLANRLGIGRFKWELEDLAYRYLDPDGYRAIARSIDERRPDREAYMERIIAMLRRELQQHDTLRNATVTGRPKHIYSIAKKMERKNLTFDQIYDVRAVRIIVDTIPDCYLALGVVHNLWRPIPHEIDDYIASPKDNFYQSLHTAVRDQEGKTIEVQIRTREMHEHAEYGIAAHWRYKENRRRRDERYERHIAYLRRLMEFGKETEDAAKFVAAMKTEVFNDRVYAITPKGDIVDLPAGSTPIDFAYHIHTDIGHRCRGAKVGGRLVNLDYQLQNGDQVEIIVAKRGGPSLDWLNENLGFVKTERARSQIRYYVRKLTRERHIHNGRDVLEREMRKLGVIDMLSYEQVARLFNFDRLDDFLAQVGAGDITGGQIASKILEIERREREERERHILRETVPVATLTVDSPNGIDVM
ncbi:MAG: TGS domain-containing protein, partial [Anaerolinea sp.]|nr:TGS domain-containing protein [Anaerolinea sp.]